MTSSLSEADFGVLAANTGLPLSAEQTATLYALYPTLQAIIARVAAPMPREAEPALIFPVEQR